VEASAQPWAVIALVIDDAEVPIGTVDATARCDIDTVDRLLRLFLVAKRNGLSIRLTAVRCDLRELVDLVGLAEQLGIT